MRPLGVGVRFCPTDEELLLHYLRGKLLDQPVYGDVNPWELFTDDGNVCKYNNQEIIYVFTKLSKIKQGKKNISRVAGCGTWHGSTGAKAIVIDKTKVGYKKTFKFTLNDRSDAANASWIMHEYTLCGAGLEGIHNNDYVVCKVIKNLPKDFKSESEFLKDIECSGKGDSISTDSGKRKSRSEDDYISKEKKIPRVDSIEDVSMGNEDQQFSDDINHYVSHLEDLLFADDCLNLDDFPGSGDNCDISSCASSIPNEDQQFSAGGDDDDMSHLEDLLFAEDCFNLDDFPGSDDNFEISSSWVSIPNEDRQFSAEGDDGDMSHLEDLLFADDCVNVDDFPGSDDNSDISSWVSIPNEDQQFPAGGDDDINHYMPHLEDFLFVDDCVNLADFPGSHDNSDISPWAHLCH